MPRHDRPPARGLARGSRRSTVPTRCWIAWPEYWSRFGWGDREVPAMSDRMKLALKIAVPKLLGDRSYRSAVDEQHPQRPVLECDGDPVLAAACGGRPPKSVGHAPRASSKKCLGVGSGFA